MTIRCVVGAPRAQLVGVLLIVLSPAVPIDAGPVANPCGTYGWDPTIPSIPVFFLAIGPTGRGGVTVGPVGNVDVSPMIAEWLGLPPAADVDGRVRAIRTLTEHASESVAR
jgi:hypothetical protein